MPSHLVALALLVAGTTVTGVAVVTALSGPGQGRPSSSTVAFAAGPRPAATVLPARSPTGVPPGPAGDLALPVPPRGAAATAPAGSTGQVGSAGQVVPSGGGFVWPVAGTVSVLRPFSPGPHPWSPGHRGVDVVGAGGTVLAAGAGRVSFAGTIGGRGVVVIEHGGRLRTTYEPVSPRVVVGQAVDRGDPIGSLQPGAPHCSPGPCLHWGARIAERYLDPLSLINGNRRPPVLLPLRGSSG